MYQIILKSGQIMYTNVLEFVVNVQDRMKSGEFGIVTHEFGLVVDSSEVAGIAPLPNSVSQN